MGRFMTPDWAARPTTVPYASFGDPQTLNLYSYVENSPLNRADADGHSFGLAFTGIVGNINGILDDPVKQIFEAMQLYTASKSGPAPDSTHHHAHKIKVPLGGAPPAPKPPRLNGTNPVSGKPGLATNPKGVPGNMRPGAPGSGQGYFGARRDGGRQHQGFDISGRPHFDMVMSWKEGTVTKVGNDPSGYGNYVDVSHDDGLTSRYAHLSAVGVEEGEAVTEGEILGVVGQTGNAGTIPESESHVHFEIRRDGQAVDPRAMLNQPAPEN
jgi:murein DD-endopeptidase MepM/ murein hydrolase activator NlpD